MTKLGTYRRLYELQFAEAEPAQVSGMKSVAARVPALSQRTRRGRGTLAKPSRTLARFVRPKPSTKPAPH